VDIDNKESQDDRMTLLLGPSTIIDILSLVMPKIFPLPVNPADTYPALTSGCEEEGISTTAVLAFK
jgi:hypothetical protein